LSHDKRDSDKHLRSMLAQLATVIVVFLAIAVGLLAYAVLRPQHYAPVKIDQNVRVQVTCPADESMVGWIPPTTNGKG
jgi:hypothetical protein